MSFRIGRKYAQHVYPTPRGAGAQPLARNSALCTAPGQQLTSGNQAAVIWSNGGVNGVESNPVGAPGTIIPITPRATGRVRIIATVTVIGAAAVDVLLAAAIRRTNTVGPPAPIIPAPSFAALIPAGTTPFNTLTFVFDITPLTTGGALPIGVATNLEVMLTATNEDASLFAAVADVQELVAPTG